MQKKPIDQHDKPAMPFIHGAQNGLARDSYDINEKDHQQAGQLRGGHVSNEALLELRKWLEQAGHDKHQEIEHAPGFGLVEFLSYLCRHATLENRLKPLHGEYLALYFDALKTKRSAKARWLKVQMYFYLVYTVIDEVRSFGRYK